MKFVALLLSASAATASASIIESLFSFGMNRNLASMCLDETTELFDESEMTSAYEAVEEEVDGKSECWMPGNEAAYCIVDFDTFDSAEDFIGTCSSIGGNTIKVNAEIQCRYNVALPTQRNADIGFAMTYSNMMDCVSDSCEADEITDNVSKALKSTAIEVGEKTNSQCSYTSMISLEGSDSEVVIEGGDNSISAEEDGHDHEEHDHDEESGTADPLAEESLTEEETLSSGHCRVLMKATVAAAMVPLVL